MNKAVSYVSLSIAAVALLLVLPLLIGTQSYAIRIFNEIWLNSIVIFGVFVILGLTKQFSLGQVAFFGIGAYATAWLTATGGLNFFVALPLAALTAAVVAFLVAIPATRFEGPWFSLVTFAFAEIARVLMLRLKDVTGGAGGFYNIPRPSIGSFEFVTEVNYYYLLLPFAVAILLLTVALRYSPYGRIWLAVGDSSYIAASMGQNVVVHRMLSFVIGSFFAGLAGGLFASYTTYISPESFSLHHTIYFLTVLVVGGLESIVGMILSVAAFSLLNNYLIAFHPWDLIVQGLIIVLFMNFLPRGLGSIIPDLYAAFFRAVRKGSASAPHKQEA